MDTFAGARLIRAYRFVLVQTAVGVVPSGREFLRDRSVRRHVPAGGAVVDRVLGRPSAVLRRRRRRTAPSRSSHRSYTGRLRHRLQTSTH